MTISSCYGRSVLSALRLGSVQDVCGYLLGCILRTIHLADSLDTASVCLQVDDMLKPNALDMLLFVLYLYQALPQLVPRATVEFMGRLQEKQVNMILSQLPHKCQKVRVHRSLQHS